MRATLPAWVAIIFCATPLGATAQDQDTTVEMLVEVALAFDAARLTLRAIDVRERLIDRFPGSAEARGAMFTIAADYRMLAMYPESADWYTRFASLYPAEVGDDCTNHARRAGRCPDAVAALQEAIDLRAAIGPGDALARAARLFERNYARRHLEATMQNNYLVGVYYASREDWPRTAVHHGALLRRFGGMLRPDTRIEATLSFAKAQRALGNHAEAARRLRGVVSLWRGAESAIEEYGLTPAERRAALWRIAGAAAEAYFLQAETLRAAWLTETARSTSDSQVGWFMQRAFELLEVQAAYVRVAEPEPHPVAWHVASAARIGGMYMHIVREAQRASAMDGLPQGFERHALDKHEYCLTTARIHRLYDTWATGCAAALFELEPDLYPERHELTGLPDHESRGARPGGLDPAGPLARLRRTHP